MKRLLERLAVASGLARALRRSRNGRTLILAYHNVVPRGAAPGGDRSLHLPQDQFAHQLDVLAEHCAVIPLGEALEPESGGQPRVAITFDDAYAGTVTAGVEELVRRGLPGTIFVVPGFLGGRTFWWDELAREDTGEVPRDVRSHALGTLEGRYEPVVDWARGNRLPRRETGPADRTATEDDLTSAVTHPGITLGAHTWTHPNLERLGTTELEREVTTPLKWLRERFPAATLPWLSYPYGRESAAVRDAARGAGYRAALRVDGGWIPVTPGTPWALPRLNVPAGLSIDGFILRLSGIGS